MAIDEAKVLERKLKGPTVTRAALWQNAPKTVLLKDPVHMLPRAKATEAPAFNILCLRQGTAFPRVYVERLHAMCRRHLTVPFDFYCYTDQPSLDTFDLVNGKMRDLIIHRDISDFHLPRWWGKMLMFNPAMRPPGDCIFFDLDTVILDNIDEMFTRPGKQNFVILRNFLQPPVRKANASKHAYGSAVMYWKEGFGDIVWNAFNDSKEENMRLHKQGGDQEYIERVLGTGAQTWQEVFYDKPNYFRSVKFPERWVEGAPPDGCHVACFHGQPRPHEVATVPWVAENWST